MTKAEQAALLAIFAILAGAYLASRPDCKAGCQTVAQHLMQHGFGTLLG
jgi:hypothetical protein